MFAMAVYKVNKCLELHSFGSSVPFEQLLAYFFLIHIVEEIHAQREGETLKLIESQALA